MVALPVSEFRRVFPEAGRQLDHGPVEIVDVEGATAFVVPAKLYLELISNFRKVVRTTSLSPEEMDLISQATVETDEPYSLDDIPDIEEEHVLGSPQVPTFGR